ncbi:serine/threonine-protein kinase [Isosphaeraceae bacterium EP7]
MIDPRSTRFWRLTLQSGLLSEAELQACYGAISPHKRADAEALERRIARQAILAGRLTLWQAQQLLNGRPTLKIDRFILLELLGQGGMGRVYLARDTRLKRKVALKLLSPERMSSPRAITRFRREARAGAQLQHEHLVRVFDEGEADGRLFLVMEYIEGRNAGQIVADLGPFSPSVAARLVFQVALALDHARLQGLIHRDVNPYNILVTRDGKAKLTDLGLALDLAEEDRVTRDGATVGTFDYISPEQARHSHAVDTRSDIYSLGCTLFHLITGRVPFAASSLAEKLYAHQVLSPEPLSKLVPEVPEGLDAVVRRMMEKDPERRYATPHDVAEALEPFAHDERTPFPHRTRSRPATLDDAGPPPTSSEGELAVSLAQNTARAEGGGAGPSPATGASTIRAVHHASDMDLAVLPFVDVGPDVPLTYGIGGSANGSRTRIKPFPLPGGRRFSPRMLAGGALALVGIVLVALLIRQLIPTPAPVTTTKGTIPGTSNGTGGAPRPQPQPVPPAGPAGIVVRWAEGPDQHETAHVNLHEAMADAARNRGEVILREGKALEVLVGVEQTLTPAGNITIRAEQGHHPTLILRIEGTAPFLRTRPETRLKLVGLTIQAVVAPQATPKALIIAQGDLELERCSMVASRSPRGFAAIWAEGMSNRVVGCFFHGFDQPVRLSARPGSRAVLSQSILIAPDPDRREASTESGWAVRVFYEPRGGNDPAAAPKPADKAKEPPRGARLALDHCTFVGRGLLDLSRFGPDAPLAVEADSLAIKARSLLAWRAPVGGQGPAAAAATPPFAQGLTWTGRDNAYSLPEGSPWVEHDPGDPRVASAPATLAAWAAGLAPGSDSAGRLTTLAFQSPAALVAADDVESRLYALTPESAGTPPAGANPADVGP